MPPPKRFLHIVWFKASSFRWQYPLPSLRSSSNFLCLLPLLVTSISPFIFPSITCHIRQFLCNRGSISQYVVSPFLEEVVQESNNVVVFPFAFHIAVQQPFKPPWSHLLLYKFDPSWASFALCIKSLLMTLLPASVLGLSLSDAYPSTCPAREALPVAMLLLV